MTKIMLSTLMFLALSAAAGEGKPAAKAADGKATFAAKCATCHGKDGKGNASMAKMFKVEAAKLDLTAGKAGEAELVKVITDGREKMPKFGGKLDDAAIKAAAQYVLSLRPADKPAK